MYKLVQYPHQNIVKSFDIYDLWKFIVSNDSEFTYAFLIDYEVLSTDLFLKLFLEETNDYNGYLRMYRKLKETTTIFHYGKVHASRSF